MGEGRGYRVNNAVGPKMNESQGHQEEDAHRMLSVGSRLVYSQGAAAGWACL